MERWKVRTCAQHPQILVGDLARSHCRYCGGRLSEPFEVVRAPTAADLAGAGQARASDPATAKAAGAIKVTRGSQRWKVLEALRSCGRIGATSHELEELTGVRYASLTPRIGELKRGGLIVATDRTRRGRYGVDQEVLLIAPLAVASIPDLDPELESEVEEQLDLMWE